MATDSDPLVVAKSAAAMCANLSHTIGVLQKLTDTNRQQLNSFENFFVHGDSEMKKSRDLVVEELAMLDGVLIGAKILLKQARRCVDKAHKVSRQG